MCDNGLCELFFTELMEFLVPNLNVCACGALNLTLNMAGRAGLSSWLLAAARWLAGPAPILASYSIPTSSCRAMIQAIWASRPPTTINWGLHVYMQARDKGDMWPHGPSPTTRPHGDCRQARVNFNYFLEPSLHHIRLLGHYGSPTALSYSKSNTES